MYVYTRILNTYAILFGHILSGKCYPKKNKCLIDMSLRHLILKMYFN